MHEEWTDKLSEYLDGELPDDERYAVESHLSGCAYCAAVLADLQRVVTRAQALYPRPPQADVWAGIAERISDRPAAEVVAFRPRAEAAPRRVSFTLPQAMAASLLIAMVSGGLVWVVSGGANSLRSDSTRADTQFRPGNPGSPGTDDAEVPVAPGPDEDVQLVSVGVADPQYDAAVTDLENAVKKGRGRLDANTIAIVEHNLQIIDRAIDQARQALTSDPANSYLSGHLFEARRRKLDLLRRAAELTSETD